jgi:hypothetical protein
VTNHAHSKDQKMVESDGVAPPSRMLEFPQESALYELSYDPLQTCTTEDCEKAGSPSRNDARMRTFLLRRHGSSSRTGEVNAALFQPRRTRNLKRAGEVRMLRDIEQEGSSRGLCSPIQRSTPHRFSRFPFEAERGLAGEGPVVPDGMKQRRQRAS